MFESSDSQLRRLSRQSLQKRYESDEEDMSESDAGHDFVPSQAGSQQATQPLDSGFGDNENPFNDTSSGCEKNPWVPYCAKRPRPISMDTIKRNSDTTFAEDNYVFDPEGEVILEIPSPLSTPVLASDIFLQPTIYVQPDSPPISSTSRTRSSSSSSTFSVENAEIQIARKITMMEPPTRPTLIFIKSRAKSAKNRPSTRSRLSSRESIFMGEHLLDIPRQARPTRDRALEELKQASVKPKDNSSAREQPPTLSATINRVSEIPDTFYLPPSPRMRPQTEYRSHLRVSGSEKPPSASARPRGPAQSPSRPASTRSSSSNSVQSYSSRPTSPFPENPRHGYVPDKKDSSSPNSLASTTSTARRSPSVSNLLANRSPMMRRVTTRKHSSSSIYSMSSLRSEMDMTIAPAPLHPHSKSPKYDFYPVRKSTQSRHSRHISSNSTYRGFMGLKLGKRSFRI